MTRDSSLTSSQDSSLGNPKAAAAAGYVAREEHPQTGAANTGGALAVITGASTGIGLALAQECAKGGFELLVCADEPRIHEAASMLRNSGATVEAVQADLSTEEGVARLVAAVGDRPVDALLANAGRALGDAFLDQDLDEALGVIDTNIRGTTLLVYHLGRQMRGRRRGRILITSSIAAFAPAPFLALYNASKAFLHSFAFALRDELQDSNVSVTCLMPGLTDTEIFRRAHTEDTKLATSPKMSAAEVAQQGFQAMMEGRGGVITGLSNKLTVAQERLVPTEWSAASTRTKTEPGTARP